MTESTAAPNAPDKQPIGTSANGPLRLTGGCHCGAVRFQAELSSKLAGSRCNCSICTKTSVISAMVKPSSFQLLSSPEQLGEYEWGGKISKRVFCKNCGVHCFGRGHLAELGGDYVSLNLNCLDGVDPNQLPVVHWDGRHDNWHAGPRSSPWPIFESADASAAART